MEISEWFKTQDYAQGLKIYASSEKAKTRTLATLQRGKSNRNMSLLISELRKLKTANLPHKKNTTTKVSTPKKVNVPRSKKIEVQTELERNQQKEEASKSYFQKIRYGELPPELKVRFRQLKDLFYDMCDLKFMLNDLPAEAEDEALQIIIKIEVVDQQKEQVWKELDHWQNYKTLLPTKTEDDFSELTPADLFRKKASLTSSVHKMKNRIDKWKKEASAEDIKKIAVKLQQKINRTEKRLHQNELNLQKIEELL